MTKFSSGPEGLVPSKLNNSPSDFTGAAKTVPEAFPEAFDLEPSGVSWLASSRLFITLISFAAKSSKPSVMSFPINADIPASNCKAGRSMQETLAACRARRQAKLTRAHSAAARCPDVLIETEEDDLLNLEPILGELETRASALGCNGEFGNEVERRREPRADFLRASFAEAGLCSVGVFIASLRAFRVELMTSVAKMYFSFEDNCCSVSTSLSCTGVFAPRVPALEGVFALDLIAVAFGLAAAVVLVDDVEAVVFDFGSKRSLRSVTIAGVHVVVDLTAVLMESAFSCKEAIVVGVMA